MPSEDAAVLTSLKQAGAIMMGKTVTTEFACLDPSQTLNPWNPAHTPGGSSSGSAVSVATGMCPVALGSQTVGSVLRPASYNGVVGLKPTYGRVSRHNVVPVSWSLDTMGWMARSVEDAALMLQIMAGPDANDPVCARFPAGDYLSGLEDGAPPRISLVTSFFMEESDEETQRHTRAMLQKLAAAGAEVNEVRLPDSFVPPSRTSRLSCAARLPPSTARCTRPARRSTAHAAPPAAVGDWTPMPSPIPALWNGGCNSSPICRCWPKTPTC